MSKIVWSLWREHLRHIFIIGKFCDITLWCFSAPAILFPMKEVGAVGPIHEGVRQADSLC